MTSQVFRVCVRVYVCEGLSDVMTGLLSTLGDERRQALLQLLLRTHHEAAEEMKKQNEGGNELPQLRRV